MNILEPPYTTTVAATATTTDADKIHGNAVYIYGLCFFLGFFILIIVFYISYICKQHIPPPPPPPPATNQNHCIIRFSHGGLNDDVLVTFPTFVYSELFVMFRKEDDTATKVNAVGSGCNICLSDYKPADVIRLLPECGHFFHVKCVDTWMKVSPTCPVCRRSLLADIAPV
ncbi:hypothetical protein R6Q57_005025 [Mikania cordata]